MNSRIFGVVLFLCLYFVLRGHGAKITTTARSTTTIAILEYVDFTNTNGTKKTNNRLCEDKEQFYFNETKRCYFPTNSLAVSSVAYEDIENPCGQLQHFYPASENYGDCDCVRRENGCEGREVLHRPVLNWPGSKKCYYAYDQGPCKEGEWIVMNRKTFQSECKPNPCKGRKLQAPLYPPNNPVEVFWFTKGDTCYQTFTKAFCKEGEYAQFEGTSPYPSCFEKKFVQVCAVASGTTATLPCAQGTKRIGDKCVPEVEVE